MTSRSTNEEYPYSEPAPEHDDYAPDSYDEEYGSSSPDFGQLALIGLVVLSVGASVLMLVTDSDAALKIALLASLWAAVVGIFLVNRYRNQVQDNEDELEWRESAYQAELDKVMAQHEAERANSTALAVGEAGGIDMEVLSQIKQELTEIRAQLSDLSERDLSYEPAALRAEARRIMELEEKAEDAASYSSTARSNSYATEEAYSDSFSQPSAGAPSADAVAGRVGSQPQSAQADNPLINLIQERQEKAAAQAEQPRQDKSRFSDSYAPSAEETTTFDKVPSTPKDSYSRFSAGAQSTASTRSEESNAPKNFDTGSFQSVNWNSGGAESAKPQPETSSFAAAEKDSSKSTYQSSYRSTYDSSRWPTWSESDDSVSAPVSHEAPEPAPVNKTPEQEATERRGRRRSDSAERGSVSVAELMAAMKKGK